jgi:hypothetical protein
MPVRRRGDVSIHFEHDRDADGRAIPHTGAFRVDYGLPERPSLAKEDRPGAAKASVSRLLAEAFGQPTGVTRPAAVVPSHLRKYVKR